MKNPRVVTYVLHDYSMSHHFFHSPNDARMKYFFKTETSVYISPVLDKRETEINKKRAFTLQTIVFLRFEKN